MKVKAHQRGEGKPLKVLLHLASEEPTDRADGGTQTEPPKGTDMKKEEILDKAADLMAEEILTGNIDIAKCFAIGLKAMKQASDVEAEEMQEPSPEGAGFSPTPLRRKFINYFGKVNGPKDP
jgi:hypothetical protein